MSLVSSYQKSTSHLEKRLNGLIRFQLPKGSVKGVISSFGASFVVNMVFMRTLEGSFRGASIAAVFKLTQIVLHAGLEYYDTRDPEQENVLLPPNKRVPLQYPFVDLFVTSAGLFVFNKISAVWTFFTTVVAYLAVKNSTYIAFPSCVVLKS